MVAWPTLEKKTKTKTHKESSVLCRLYGKLFTVTVLISQSNQDPSPPPSLHSLLYQITCPFPESAGWSGRERTKLWTYSSECRMCTVARFCTSNLRWLQNWFQQNEWKITQEFLPSVLMCSHVHWYWKQWHFPGWTDSASWVLQKIDGQSQKLWSS